MEPGRAGKGSLVAARPVRAVRSWVQPAPLPVQNQNLGISNEPTFPDPQFMTDDESKPDEIRTKKLDGHYTRLAWQHRAHFTQIEPSVKEIAIDAQRTAPPPGWRWPRSPSCIRGKQPQFDNSIRRPKCHSGSFSSGSIQPRKRL